jgi:hypothetical protein
MITYTYEKPIEDIPDTDLDFSLIFTDGEKIHLDSVPVPRLEDNSVNVPELEQRITNLNEYVLNKFGNYF